MLVEKNISSTKQTNTDVSADVLVEITPIIAETIYIALLCNGLYLTDYVYYEGSGRNVRIFTQQSTLDWLAQHQRADIEAQEFYRFCENFVE